LRAIRHRAGSSFEVKHEIDEGDEMVQVLIPSISLLAGAIASFLVWHRYSINSRIKRIERFVFPASIAEKVKAAYPHLTDAQAATVMKGLREYFLVALTARRRMVSMPSKVIDVAWHEFILFTRSYQVFCLVTLGHFLHHTPSEAMRTPTRAQDGIKRAWRLSCKREGINPSTPSRLPLLFAIDGMLAIPDGYRYSLNCRSSLGAQSTSNYCASHIACAGGCGGSAFAGDGCGGDSAGGDGGDGGGCGGGGGD
jgi:hypothetical protein